jgi:hypothetical protein
MNFKDLTDREKALVSHACIQTTINMFNHFVHDKEELNVEEFITVAVQSHDFAIKEFAEYSDIEQAFNLGKYLKIYNEIVIHKIVDNLVD